METNDTWDITFTPNEVLTLANLLQLADWPGLLLPVGVSDDELEKMIEQGYEMLIERNFLVQENDVPMLPSAILRIFHIIQYAYSVFMLSSAEISSEHFVFMHPDGLVEQEYLPDGQMRLTAIRSIEVFHKRATDFLGLAKEVASSGESFTLAQNMSMDQALKEMSVPEEVKPALQSVLKGTKQFNSFVSIDPINRQEVARHIAWLDTPQGVWKIDEVRGDSGCIWRFSPIEIASLYSEITNCLVMSVA